MKTTILVNPSIDRLLALLAVLAIVSGCSPRSTSEAEGLSPEEAEGVAFQLPEIAGIGGAQDVWPFEFGFDASRATVEAEFGIPTGTEARPAGPETPAFIESRMYPNLQFMFFVDEESEFDQLLSVRISGGVVALRGGVEVGMSVDAARSLLGEPGVENDETLVYFYYSTTIELAIEEGRVTAVTLSRAMP